MQRTPRVKGGERFLPLSEHLTPKRVQMAIEIGLKATEISEQWTMMADHEFRRPYRDWDRVWRNWCRNYRQWERPKLRVVPPCGAAAPSVEKTKRILGWITGGKPLFKTMVFALALFIPLTAHATRAVSWFAYTPVCCNAAAIRTDILPDNLSRYLGGRFEYYRLKNDGTCQHVKHTYGDAHITGYVHFANRSTAEGYFENSMDECCGLPGNPYARPGNCTGVIVFYGPDPTFGESMGIPAGAQ